MEDMLLAAAFVLMALSSRAAGGLEARTFPAAGLKKIVVETAGGDVALAVAEGKSVSTVVSPAPKPNDQCEITQELKDGVLTLRAQTPRSGIFSVGKSCSAGFSVKAPARVAIAGRSGSGDAAVGAFSGALDFRTGSGDIALSGPSGALTLRSGSGKIAGKTASRELDASTGSGGIELSGLTGGASAKSGSGLIALSWSVSPKKGEIEVRTGSGGFKGSFPPGTKFSASLITGSGSVDNEFGSDSSAALSLNVRSGSGDVSLTKTPR